MGLSWYIRRLKAMSPAEVAYRLVQKRIRSNERKAYTVKRPVYDVSEYGPAPRVDLNRLGINFANCEYFVGSEIELLGGYSYADYRKRWHAAFQSEGDWPMRFAADYNFGDDDVPGDIRTNWELNRHFQFALLAKSFFVSREKYFFDTLVELFEDWNASNPFMWGPEWSSPMESAIRVVNWLTAAAFLDASGVSEVESIRRKLCNGAYVMAANIRLHYSRYSSANNHTIVEAAGVAIAACIFGRDDWRDEALDLLEREVALQTWPDGVNKEQALHYQLFVMEALCLVAHTLKASGSSLPASIRALLRSMARYAMACRVGDAACVEFGDDDEGIIFNPCTKKPFYLGYVLAFVSLEVADAQCWSKDCDSYEQLRWLFVPGDIDRVAKSPLFVPAHIESFPQGGITIVRASEGRVVFAFDHGPLGFGSLAAHGHADALSVQLYIEGEPVLIDPGTGIYNGDRAERDLFRSTGMHNTICIGGIDQSEIKGPFLWGKKARVGGYAFVDGTDAIRIRAEFEDFSSHAASRLICVKEDAIVVSDDAGDLSVRTTYMTPLCVSQKSSRTVVLTLESGSCIRIDSDADLNIKECQFSPSYGIVRPCWSIFSDFSGRNKTTIQLEDENR